MVKETMSAVKTLNDITISKNTKLILEFLGLASGLFIIVLTIGISQLDTID